MSKVLDPIGLVIPLSFGARLLLNENWRVRWHHWDEELPKDTVESFLEWSATSGRYIEASAALLAARYLSSSHSEG